MNLSVQNSILHAKEHEKIGEWPQALTHWKTARALNNNGDQKEYIQENINSLELLIEAIDEGDRIRKATSDQMKQLTDLDIETKKQMSWLIQGAHLSMITKEARLELEQFINKYPGVPRAVIISWGLDFYAAWQTI